MRRDRIFSGALRLFAQTGFDETTMDQVAAAAELSKAALYLYFPSKDALLKSLLKRYMLLPEVPELVATVAETPPEVAIPRLIREMWQRLCERKDLAHLLVREIQSNPERARLLSKHVGQPASRALAGYLDRWIKRGAIARQDTLVAAQCVFGMLWYFLLTQELMGGRELYPIGDEQIVGTVSRIFLDGIGTSSSGRTDRPIDPARPGSKSHHGQDK
jgi:AcrR family transcriptional regulator